MFKAGRRGAKDLDEFECPIQAERYGWLTGGPPLEL